MFNYLRFYEIKLENWLLLGIFGQFWSSCSWIFWFCTSEISSKLIIFCKWGHFFSRQQAKPKFTGWNPKKCLQRKFTSQNQRSNYYLIQRVTLVFQHQAKILPEPKFSTKIQNNRHVKIIADKIFSKMLHFDFSSFFYINSLHQTTTVGTL